mmetsp:Transcript_97677/g.168407  ORF Transcript_97677/g.168407 Transcript_97677/m.168407 type:complete len:289 (+) Transcript_97677:1441-2307(+)
MHCKPVRVLHQELAQVPGQLAVLRVAPPATVGHKVAQLGDADALRGDVVVHLLQCRLTQGLQLQRVNLHQPHQPSVHMCPPTARPTVGLHAFLGILCQGRGTGGVIRTQEPFWRLRGNICIGPADDRHAQVRSAGVLYTEPLWVLPQELANGLCRWNLVLGVVPPAPIQRLPAAQMCNSDPLRGNSSVQEVQHGFPHVQQVVRFHSLLRGGLGSRFANRLFLVGPGNQAMGARVGNLEVLGVCLNELLHRAQGTEMLDPAPGVLGDNDLSQYPKGHGGARRYGSQDGI